MYEVNNKIICVGSAYIVHSYTTITKGILYEWKPHYCWPHIGQSNEFK